MAKQTWNNPIDKSVDWGGDATTGNLPVSGEQVQKFIKETFDKKAGVFHYDNTNNRYLVFADASTRDEFLLDPTKTDLVLGTFDAPFNYTAEINLTSNAYNAVFLGSTGNYIDFTFDIKNKQGASTGENVTVTYTFIRNAVRQTVTETRKYGDVVHFNVDKYIGEGTNTVMVGVTGQTSLAATTVAITYQVVNLTIEDGLDISKSYSLQNGSQLVEVPFTVSGYGTKVVEWYLDGEMLPFVKVEDEVVDVIATRTKYITLSNLQQGTHSLQMRAYSLVNGEKFYTNTLYRDLLVYTGANSDVIIGVATTIPREYGVIGAGDSVAIYDMVQYVPYTLRFATYSPSNAASTEVTIKLDGVVKGVVGSANGVENEFVLTSTSSGNKILNLSTLSVSKDFNVLVKETDMNIQEIQSGLTLDFNAEGKTNNSPDRDTWSFGNYEGTLSGFNWNNSSGWVNGRLEMSAGSSFGINYAPLSGNPTSTGKTIEIEWATKSVTNDDAVICDLRGDNGVGILITATKVSMTSADGVTVETEYKSDENVRIGFVINKSSGTTNKQMSFIYTNGIVSRSEAWAVTDNYISDKTMLFTASAEAEVSLKAIRIYDAALTSDNMLNNYTLYRDTIEEMMAVYDRNDVYEEGTTVFSPEKMMNRLPVMIVTGDIPILENTSDKDTQIVVDIEYFNGDKSFTMKSAAMRPQGTSSMGYPKKNFRIYTQKVANTLLYDSKGNLVEDKLYSFKDGAQPVNCWCLKADYAESSGTHNTGIARLWNEALYNAQIDGEYKLRTEAQKAAEAVGYEYDVRTTIDGFPILLFYRPNANADLIFIGKYNFNNDKSTESVFGFEGIPNFDNSKMQCWEVLNNGNALALFTTAEGFDAGWSEAFESRYPDTKTPYTGDLKAFCQWMSSVSQSAFATEKWEHLDVYKMAAYWCYLMRHAAADQFVKNAMFTSEDGVKWYYILYDNDTINGLINTGDIRIKPTDDRQTKDASGSYVFAGHNSKLWNFLEADEEFQEIVSKVDNALYSAGISYANTIKVFDEEQADKWVERVYNQDAQYKYVGPYAEKGINNLFMLQGKRDLHRRWWLAKRFSIYDAKYVSGTYKSEAVEIKCLNGTEAGQQFSIVAGYPLDYGYGINNVPRAKGITLNVGESHTFTTEEVVNVGDPIRIYGAPNIAELDLSAMTDRMVTLNVASANSDTLGTKMTKLVVGNPNANNLELKEISGLKGLASLEYLDVQGLKAYTSIDLTNQPYLKTLKAFGSNIVTATFAKGAPITSLELPTALKTLELNELPNLTKDGLLFESGMNGISSISIKGCPKLSKDFAWVYNWYANKTTPNETSSLVMDNVDWKDVNAEQLAELTNLGNIQLKGKVTVTDITIEQLNMLINAFGESAFDKNAELFINAPDAIFVTGRTELLEGESEDYACIVFGAEVESLTWSIYSGSSYAKIDAATGLLTTTEGTTGTRTLVIRVVARTSAGTKSIDTSVSVKARTYPASGTTTLSGSLKLNNTREVYKLEVTTPNVNGEYVVTWSLTGMDGYAEIESSNNTQCVVKKLQEATTVVNGTLTAAVKKKVNNSSLFSKTFAIELVNDTIAETDNGVVTALYNAGLCANSAYITKEEAALITDIDLQPGTSASTSVFYSQRTKIKSFEGFQYFTGITTLGPNLFNGTTALTSIKFPSSLRIIQSKAFYQCALPSIVLPEGVTTLEQYAITSYYTEYLKYLYIPSTLINIASPSIGGQGSSYHTNYIEIEVSEENPVYKSVDGVLYTKDNILVRHAKGGVSKDVVIPEWVTGVDSNAFLTDSLDSLTVLANLSSAVISLGYVSKFIRINEDIKNITVYGYRDSFTNVFIGPNVTVASLAAIKRHKTKLSIDSGGFFVLDDGILYNKDFTRAYVYTSNQEEFVIKDGVTALEPNLFENNKTAKKITVPEGVTTIPSYCFSSMSTGIEVRLPSTVVTFSNYSISTASIRVYIKRATPPTYNYYVTSYGLFYIYCPFESIESYRSSNWKNIADVNYDIEEKECLSLSITADDVAGNYSATTVYYQAICNIIDNVLGQEFSGLAIAGTTTSEEFGYNTSGEDIQRTISFTYLGVTASTTIVQSVFGVGEHSVTLTSPGQSRGWITESNKNPDPSVYDCYKNSTGTYVHCYMDIEFGGYNTFRMFFRKENKDDYIEVSELDNLEVRTRVDVGISSETGVDAYTIYEITNLRGIKHKIRVKGYFNYSGTGCYMLIPKDQEE